MEKNFLDQFDALVEKYTELLLGESTPERKEKVKMWALYTYISKSMPPLAKHWNERFPEAKEQMKAIVYEIKQLNEQHRGKSK